MIDKLIKVEKCPITGKKVFIPLCNSNLVLDFCMQKTEESLLKFQKKVSYF